MKSCCLFLLNLILFTVWGQNPKEIDSLKLVIKNTKVDTTKVWTLIALGNQIENGDPDSAFKLYKQAEEISRRVGYKLGIVKAISNFTYIMDLKGRLQESKKYYEEAIKISKELKSQILEAKGLANLGNWYNRSGKIPESIETYMQAIKITESMKDEDFSFNLKANMCNLYRSTKQYEIGLKLSNDLIGQIKKTGKHEMTIVQLLLNKGNILTDLEKWKESIIVFEEAVVYSKKYNFKEGMLASYNNLANSYRRIHQDEKSFIASKLGLSLATEIGDQSGIYTSYHNLSNLYFKKSIADSALRYIELAKKTALAAHDSSNIHLLIETEAEVYLLKGDVQKYIELAGKADSLEVILTGKATVDKAVEIEAKYKFEKKEREIIQKDLDLERNRNRIALLSGGLIFLTLLASLGFYTFRKKQQNQLLQKKVETQNSERQRIAAELHDEIGGNLTSLMYMANGLKEKNEVNPKVDLIVQTTSQISSNMNEIIWNINNGNASMQDWLMAIRQRLMDMIDHAGLEYKFEIPLDENLQDLSVETKRNLYLVLKEAVNNAIKHANAKRIEVLLLKSEPLEWSIKDDGEGFETGGNRGNGLKNMKNRMEKIGGSIEWIRNSGTEVRIIA